MVKVKTVRFDSLEDLMDLQYLLLEENENYTFRVVGMFLKGYCLEVYESKREKLYSLLDGYYECFREEVKKLEKINSQEVEDESME